MIPGWLESEVTAYDMPMESAPRVVLDIGASIGAFTLRALQKWPNALVFAYEPNPEVAKQYLEHTAGKAGAFLIQAGVRDQNGTADLLLGDNIATSGFHNLGRSCGQTVTVQTIDAAQLPKAEFVKIDTEGDECIILERLDLSQCESLVVEFHRKDDFPRLLKIARAKGMLLHEVEHSPHNPHLGVIKWTRRVIPERLFIGIPIYGGVEGSFMRCLLALEKAHLVGTLLSCRIGDSLVPRSRNELTYEFLGTNCASVLFMDCDLVFNPMEVKRLNDMPDELVGGAYPKKQPNLVWVCNTLPGVEKPREDGLYEVRYVGSGFMRCKRSVFEKIVQKFGAEISYQPDHDPTITNWDFWRIGVWPPNPADGKRRYLSEDWFLCELWRECGGHVWMDTHMPLKHIGSAVFPMPKAE